MENDKFNKRSGTTDHGKDYENFVTAQLILQLVLDDTVQNFKISSNDDSFGAFDDIVVEIESNAKKKLYAMQLKHCSNDKTLSRSSFETKKKQFYIKKYFDTFKEMKQSEIPCMILYTNKKLSNNMKIEFKNDNGDMICVNVEQTKSEKLFPEELCYKFEITNNEQLSPESQQKYEKFFNNLYLYTNQPNVKKTEMNVRSRFEEIFACSSEESEKFLQFVSRWSLLEGKKYKLDKSTMRKVIALSALHNSIKPLAFTHPNREMILLRQAIDNFDITIIQEESYDKIKYCCSDLQNKLTETTTKELSKKFQITPFKQNMTDIDIYSSTRFLWLLEMYPLIVSENQTAYNVMNVCSKEKFILIAPTASADKLSREKVFQKLSDLDSKSQVYQEIITTFKCLMQGKESVSLDFLIKMNDDIRNAVTINDLVNMLECPYQLGEKEKIPQPYINRSLSLNYIHINYFKNVDKNTIIVLDCMDRLEKILCKMGNFNHIDIELFFRDDDNIARNSRQTGPNHRPLFHTSPYLKNYVSGADVYVSKQCSYDDFEKICAHNPNVSRCHHLKIIDENTLEWIRSKGDLSDLERFRRDVNFVEETRFYDNQPDNNVNLIRGDPGLGKSELLKNIKNNCGVEMWCVFFQSIDITSMCARLEDIHADEREEKLIEFIINIMYAKYSDFAKRVIKLLIEHHHVAYFWDAVDEITAKDLETITSLIKELTHKSVCQWITSRCHLKKQLEKTFNVFSRNVNQFSEKEQTVYIHQRLKGVYPDEHINKVIHQIRSTVTVIKHNNVLGTPLQIYMITELFRQDSVKYKDILEKLFSLTDLYQHIINEKFNTYYTQKADVRSPNIALLQVLEGYKKSMFEKYEKAGLKALIKKEVFKQLNIYVDDFLDEIHNGADSIGLITEVTDKFPQFLHNSYAEFFVARFFIEHHQDIQDFEKIITDHRYVNVRFFYDLLTAKDSPVFKAVLYKNTDLLMKQDVDRIVSCEDTEGRNVLQVACSWGQRHPDLEVETEGDYYIINNENDESLSGETKEYVEMLQYLLDNCESEDGQESKNSALDYANKFECLLPKLKLLRRNSSKLLNDKEGLSILYYSAKFGYREAIELFEEVPYVKTKKDNFSLLHLAVSFGQGKYVQKLLSIDMYRKNINDKDNNGETALYKASQNGYYNLVVLLVDHGADVNAKTNNGSTALHTACLHLHTNIVRFLLSSNANINAVKDFGITPLHGACWNGHEAVVELLLDKNADINSKADDGCTPLYVASRNRHHKVVELLLKRGADINLAQEDGVTPLFIACQEGHTKNVDLLLKYEADVNLVTKSGEFPLYVACQNGHEAVVRKLIMFGADMNAVANNGFMALHIACQQGFANVVRLLIEQGVDCKVCSDDGMTPICVATNLGYDDIVSLLKKSRWQKALTTVQFRLNFVKKLRI